MGNRTMGAKMPIANKTEEILSGYEAEIGLQYKKNGVL